VTYLDIGFSCHFLFELSTCEDHQDIGGRKGNLPEREQVILRKCSSSEFKDLFFLSQVASFLPRLVQIMKLNF